MGKRGHKYMDQVKESGNMGTGGGTIEIKNINTKNSTNEKLERRFYEQFKSKIK